MFLLSKKGELPPPIVYEVLTAVAPLIPDATPKLNNVDSTLNTPHNTLDSPTICTACGADAKELSAIYLAVIPVVVTTVLAAPKSMSIVLIAAAVDANKIDFGTPAIGFPKVNNLGLVEKSPPVALAPMYVTP